MVSVLFGRVQLTVVVEDEVFSGNGWVKVSFYACKCVVEFGVDFVGVCGSGFGGRIVA